MQIFLEWKDDRLAFDAPFQQISLSMKMLELIWKPGLFKSLKFNQRFRVKFIKKF